MPGIVWVFATFACVAVSAATAQELTKTELGKRGKAATALIAARPGAGHGACLCVHPSGLFITAESVIRTRRDAEETLTLILDPGSKDERSLKAKVVRSDSEQNMALLRVEGQDQLYSLPLSGDEGLSELAELAAFGFNKPPNIDGVLPALSVRLTRATSLSRKQGELLRIALDGELPSGFTGGAVLDTHGRVAGIIGGVNGGVSEAISANQIVRFLRAPDVRLKLPSVTDANRHDEHLFEARIVSILPSNSEPQVDLILSDSDGVAHRHPMKHADGVFRVRASPDPRTHGPILLHITVTFPNGSIAGSVADRSITVGSSHVKLSEVEIVQLGMNGGVVRRDGSRINGSVAGLDELELRLDKAETRLSLADATEVRVSATVAKPMSYTVIVTQDKVEIGRISGGFDGTVIPDKATVVGVDDIRPPVLDAERTERMLPSTISDVWVAGGGRFLFLHMKQQRKLAVFDFNEGRIVRYIPAAEDNIRCAGGRNWFIVALPGAKVIQKWSLRTFEREVTAPLPINYSLLDIAMGSASDGPLLVWSANYPSIGEMFFFDIRSMKKLELKGRTSHGHISPDFRLRAAANGSVFTARHQCYVLQGHEWDLHNAPDGRDLLPSPDGRTLYTRGGRFTAACKPIGKVTFVHDAAVWYVPALQGPYFLALRQIREPGPQGKSSLSIELHLAGDARPVAQLPKVDAVQSLVDWHSGQTVPFDRHIFFVPDAKVLAVIPATKDRIVLQRLDFEELLRKSPVDYLIVTSQPPVEFTPGREWTYQIGVRSKKGGVKYRVDSGPVGMSITSSGLARWTVPETFDERKVDVILTITDASGQETLHTFSLDAARSVSISPPPPSGGS